MENIKINKSKPIVDNGSAKFTANVVNKFVESAHELLSGHPINLDRVNRNLPPANIIVPRGAGLTPTYESLSKKYGMKSAFVAGTGLIKGLGVALGADAPDVVGATGYFDSNLTNKAKMAIKMLEAHDFCLVHVEGIDEVSHEKDIEKKCEMIRRFDDMVGYLTERVDDDTLIVVLSDHTTSTQKGDHTADPVPILISGKTVRTDDVTSFSERTCAKGNLKRFDAKYLMSIILDLANRSEKFGA